MLLVKLVQCTGLSNQNTTAFMQHITHTSYVELVLLIKLERHKLNDSNEVVNHITY